MEICMKIIKKPVVNPERFNRIWEKHVQSLKETYRMND
jgi:acyl-CoA dehydrogenase